MSTPDTATNTKTTRRKITAGHVTKIVAWIFMGALLFIVGLMMGIVNILNPQRLTPIVERLATQSLINARVEIDRVELSVMSSFPFLHTDVRNLRIMSTITDSIDAETREMLPEWTDTLAKFERFEGGLNIIGLFKNQLDLSDVTIVAPSVNLVIIDEDHTNFNIIPVDTTEEPFDIRTLPKISLTRFEVVDPGDVRYFDLTSGTDLAVGFTQIDLIGSKAPVYTLNFDGELKVPSEVLELFNLEDFRFGLNGNLVWEQSNPTHLELSDFHYMLSLLQGTVNTSLDFGESLTINTLDFNIEPISIQRAISIIPEDIAEEFGIPTDIETTATMAFRAKLDAPWTFGSDDLPKFTLNVSIPDSRLVWNNLTLNNMSADLTFVNRSNSLDDATLTINNLTLRGPATDLHIAGTLTHLAPIPNPDAQSYDDEFIYDPLFEGTCDGTCDLSRLPPFITDMLPGTLSGGLTAHISMRGSPSMFNAGNFHRLNVKGNMALNNLYFISNDTVNMVSVDRVSFDFGTNETFVHNDIRADSLLRGVVTIDTATIVHSDLEMGLRNLKLGLSTANRASSAARDRVNGAGGGLQLDAFNLFKATDSIVVRIRDVKGYTVIKPHNDDIRTPELHFDLNVGRLATGNNETRLMIRNAATHVMAYPKPQSHRAKAIVHLADSIHRAMPHLTADSVVALAVEHHRLHPPRYSRVHGVVEDSTETIDWGTSSVLRRILEGWRFEATVASNRAAVFTPYFPLRNRIRHLDISANNDTILVRDVKYKIGRSDFLINGAITELRRALTSQSNKVPLKIHFDVVSDTIDVNQLTDATLAGSAYAANPDRSHRINFDRIGEDEEDLERELAKRTAGVNDTIMPVLIPLNIDAELAMKANNIFYSDLPLHDFSGRVLIYNGAMNLDNLSASSEIGSLNISALYTGRKADNLRFGFGMNLNNFNLHKFLHLFPAVDSLMPVLRDFSGMITADVAATVDIDRRMDLVLPSLDAAIGIKGDSLVLLDPDTFKSLSKWLFFKDKKRNMIDHMDVQMIVRDNAVTVYPFIFTLDRYKLGVQGYNDFAMNFDYHIAVLKSPIPFKFGINISGDPEKYKIRLGGAKFGEKQLRTTSIVDTTRVNLMDEIRNVFRRGARDARLARLNFPKEPTAANIDLNVDTLTRADSLRFIQEGLIPGPLPVDTLNNSNDFKTENRKARKSRKSGRNDVSATKGSGAVLAIAAISIKNRRRPKRYST